ncbi:MAG: hypothetical protein M1828_005852 [Chrysothrix sp. TS-e1954]|nr:MAG: hypothetical protein M1828_005852 [Chrysothrix sp. TS-e1954]
MAAVGDEQKSIYSLLGTPHDSLSNDQQTAGYNLSVPDYKGAQFDASTTNLTYHIAPPVSDSTLKAAEIVVSFISPITPTSSLRQSIPAAYVSIHVHADFNVDIYMDVNGRWVSADPKQRIHWSMQNIEFDETGSLASWQVQKEDDAIFTENGDQAEWGKLHFTGPPDANYMSGDHHKVRRAFANTGRLPNENEENFRAIDDQEPVFAFHKSFHLGKTNNSKSGSVLFTIAHIQDEIVQFASARGLTYMRPLWKSWFFSDYALLMFHYLDFHTAKRLGDDYSAQLEHDAYKSGGDDYVDIVALSARQVMGATGFGGTPEKPLLFLKEISSNGNTQTVDVIFPAFPFFIYTNPTWLAYLLEPLLEHQLSGQYPNKYSMHDLGGSYPNLTGHPFGKDEYMPVEECGDMLIMGLALVNSLIEKAGSKVSSAISGRKSHENYALPISITTTDGYGIDRDAEEGAVQAKSWLRNSYPIWKQWTEYLIESSLEPANQLSTDDFAGWLPLQTNLALKGIVGIKAMSELSAVLGMDADAKYYKNISETYVKKWQVYGMTRDGNHAKLAYDWYGSWTTLYSLFADSLLCFHPSSADIHEQSSPESIIGTAKQAPMVERSHTHSKLNASSNFIPSGLYANHSTFYDTVLQSYGLPLDSRHTYTKSDWMMQTAAVSSKSLRQKLTHSLAVWLNHTNTNRPFCDLFETEGNGQFASGLRFVARPVVGSHFSRLALEKSCRGQAVEGLAFLDDM